MAHLIITVDVESHSLPVDSAYRLLDILDEFKVKALFFISIMDRPAVFLGQEAHKRGHDLGLHTHDCSISKGKQNFSDYFGFMPEVHRAGGYKSSYADIEYLFENKIRYDWSTFPYHKNCEIYPEKINSPFDRCGIVWLPITGYYRRNFRGMKFVKTDIDASTFEELLFYWGNMHGYPMNLFMHSYSLQKNKTERKFIKLIELMRNHPLSWSEFKKTIDFKLPEKVPICDESIFRFVKRQFQ